MEYDEQGNPVVATEPDVNADPSSAEEPDPNLDPDLDPDLEAGEGEEEGEPSPSEPRRRKPGAEKRIGSLVAEREYWKGRAEAAEANRTSPVPAPGSASVPTDKELDPNDFDSDAAYLKAMAKQAEARLEARFEQERQRASQTELQAAIQKSAARAREAHPDFDSVALNPAVPTSQTMVDAMKGENYAEILYALGSNVAEAQRIYGLPPVQQIKEIGKIEARLTRKTPKRNSSAPDPPPTIRGSSPASPGKDPEKMTRAELHAKWEKDRKEELRRKYE
jgi:hypothetical protein